MYNERITPEDEENMTCLGGWVLILIGIIFVVIVVIGGISQAQSGNVTIDGINYSTPDSVVVVMPFHMYKDFEKWHNDKWNSTDWSPILVREFITVVKD